MAHPERFERPTLWFVARYSIQLSYGCEKDVHYMDAKPSCQHFMLNIFLKKVKIHRFA